MISEAGSAGHASVVRVTCAWQKFRELAPILTSRGVSLKLKGLLYKACVQSIMIYASERWPMKVEDTRRLERAERMMVRWMCGVKRKKEKIKKFKRNQGSEEDSESSKLLESYK